MTFRPHPRSSALLKWLRRTTHAVHVLEGEYYRVAGPRHTTGSEIVSGTGAFIAGGRWNPVGEMKAVYLSRKPETAMKEALEHFRYHGLPISTGLPKVVVAVAVRINRLLDLTAQDSTAALPIPMPDLLAEDWRALMASRMESGSQAVGWAAFTAGIQGLMVPSKPDPTGLNLVVFPENLDRDSRLEVLNARDLEKLGQPP